MNKKKCDDIKWFVSALSCCSAIGICYYATHFNALVRFVLLSLGAVFSVLLVWKTQRRSDLMAYVLESKHELLRVYWPSKQEVLRLSTLVAGMVLVVVLFLWAIDSLLISIIGWLNDFRS